MHKCSAFCVQEYVTTFRHVEWEFNIHCHEGRKTVQPLELVTGSGVRKSVQLRMCVPAWIPTMLVWG